MAQSDIMPSKPNRQDNRKAGKPGSLPLRARDVIKVCFKKARNLTTIEHNATILFDEGDVERGATPFINLVAALVDDKGPNTEPFAAKWLVRDATQIKHVLVATKARAKSLFDTLARHATVAVINESSEHEKALAEALPAGSLPAPWVLTAFPSDAYGGYDYYGHVEPSIDQDWADGPRSIPLDNVSSEVDELLNELRQAHVEKLTGSTSDKVENLEKSGISIFRLDELTK